MGEVNIYQRFQKRIGEETDKYDYLVDDAREEILAYTRRTEEKWLSAFDITQLKLAQYDFEKMGISSVASRSEGSISTSFEDRRLILKSLDQYRLIGVV